MIKNWYVIFQYIKKNGKRIKKRETYSLEGPLLETFYTLNYLKKVHKRSLKPMNQLLYKINRVAKYTLYLYRTVYNKLIN